MRKDSHKQMPKQATKPNNDEVRGNPVSLAPLSFEEALSGLLQVPPSKVKEAEKKKRTPKKR
jgi:hypothetical protein